MTRTGSMVQSHDWIRELLFDQGFLALMKGESVKVYLTMLSA